MPYVGKKPADIIATAVDTTTGTFSGEIDAASLDISGDIDVDGTTNLDAVDIDGAVDMASTLTVTGVAILNGGIDIAGDFTLDVGGGDISIKDDGTTMMNIGIENSDVIFNAQVSDKDIIFKGNDGGSSITALTLDMSDAGTATFNNRIRGAISSDGSPTYSFGTDTHTGMFSPSNDIIGFSHGGTERHRFSSNTLSIRDPSFATARFCISTDIGTYTGIDIKTTVNQNNSYFIAFTNASGSNIGGVTQNGTSAVTFETSSDYRLKENVNYSFDATTRLKQLKPCRFNFIADGTDRVLDGFLAHEVSSIVPEAVTKEKDATREIGTIKDEDGNVLKTDAPEVQKEDGQTWEKTGTENVYQGIDQSKLVPLLTKALQEQQATIEALTARIVTLENA